MERVPVYRESGYTVMMLNGHFSFLSLQFQDQAICGIVAGIVSTFCIHPLDVIKVDGRSKAGMRIITDGTPYR